MGRNGSPRAVPLFPFLRELLGPLDISALLVGVEVRALHNSTS